MKFDHVKFRKIQLELFPFPLYQNKTVLTLTNELQTGVCFEDKCLACTTKRINNINNL